MRKILFLIGILLSGCQDIERYEYYTADDPSVEFWPRLRPDEIRFEIVRQGQEIVLNSAIVMPPLGEEGIVVVEFRRTDLERAFIHALFFDPDSVEILQHPFTLQGMEVMLTDESLCLTIHPGVNMHLRTDMESLPKYRTFAEDGVTGRVVKVEGNAYYSGDRNIIRKKLEDVFSFTNYTDEIFEQIEGAKYRRLKNGSMGWVLPPDAVLPPAKYPPAIAEAETKSCTRS